MMIEIPYDQIIRKECQSLDTKYIHTLRYIHIYTLCVCLYYTRVWIYLCACAEDRLHTGLSYTLSIIAALHIFFVISPPISAVTGASKKVLEGNPISFFWFQYLFAPLAIVSAVCAVYTRGAVYRGDPCCIKVLSFLPLQSVYRFDSAVYKREYMPLVYQDAHVYWGAVYSPRTLLL